MSITYDSILSSGTQVICDQMENMIREKIDVISLEVAGNGGHFALEVKSKDFNGKSLLEKQRLVYGAIAPLMKGLDAPVHAIDRMDIHEG